VTGVRILLDERVGRVFEREGMRLHRQKIGSANGRATLN
jgi:hypothetical protein